MIKHSIELIMIVVLITIIIQLIGGNEFTCSAYSVEYKDMCIHLLENQK